MVVADATVLIVLAKMGRLHLLRETCQEVLIGPVVRNEVVDQGKAVGAAEVVQVEKAMTDGWIGIVRLTPKERKSMETLLHTSRLDDGEAESLAIARSHRCMVVIDDKEGRALAAAMGIEHMGTAGILLEAYANGRLRIDELEDTLRELSGVLWLSPAVVVEILRKARGMRK